MRTAEQIKQKIAEYREYYAAFNPWDEGREQIKAVADALAWALEQQAAPYEHEQELIEEVRERTEE